MKRKVYVLLIPAIVLTLAAVLLLIPRTATTVSSAGPANKVFARQLAIATGQAKRAPHEALLSSGAMYALLQSQGILDARADRARAAQPRITLPTTQGCQNVFSNAGLFNYRVNQDCSLRRQAEEVVVPDPRDPNHLIAGQNDSRVGFNNCGYDWSYDGGKTWGDQVPPFYQFIMADGFTADACSDPTATFDFNGNAYVAGVLFEINSSASAFVVAKSNAGIDGTFYHSPVANPFQVYRDSPLGVVASDNNANIFHDKEFIVADANANSPKRNNVYATWTRFAVTQTTPSFIGDSPIYFSQSSDGGATWSAGIEISGDNAAVCTTGSSEVNPNACDQDQGSHPIVGPDGTIYVAFGNGNTATLGLNQHLIVKCPANKDCRVAANWTAPVKIGDDYGMQPIGPDPVTACDAGRQCLPPNGYRMDDFVEGSISVDGSGKLYAVWADFRNGRGSSCDWNNGAAGQAAVATPPCDNDVFYAYSTNGGATWSSTISVTVASQIGSKSAQWMPWSAVTPSGAKLYVAYYDRSYGNCETTGCNDITLATITNPATGSPSFSYKRLTTASMPNLVVANNPLQAGFLGDYMWVAANGEGNPYVVWADTRGLNGTVEEDIYLAIWQ